MARQYQDKDKAINTRIFRTSTGSSYARFKQGGVATSRNTCKEITKVGGSSSYARFKQGGASTSSNTGKEITKAGGSSKQRTFFREKHTGGYKNE